MEEVSERFSLMLFRWTAIRSTDQLNNTVSKMKHLVSTFLCLLVASCFGIAQEPSREDEPGLDSKVQSLLQKIKNEHDIPSWPIDRLTRESKTIVTGKMISRRTTHAESA